MSFDIRDFVSFACLTNTPFPNNFATAATGIDKSDLRPEDAVIQMFDHSNYKIVVDRMRLFVAWGLGDLDKDLGLFIQKQMWAWWHKNGNYDKFHDVDSGDVEKMRMSIYGKCAGGGRDYNDYQPCYPDWSHDKAKLIDTLDKFKERFKAYEMYPKKWQKAWVACRIKLADEWAKGDAFRRERWPYLVWAMARHLEVSPALMAAGLKGEF